jgi:Domain of unknown function (DUF4261)
MADDFMDRFSGEGTHRVGKPVAALESADPVSLQLLLDASLALDAARLTTALRGYDSAMNEATAEIVAEPGTGDGAACLGLLGWGRHVVRLVGFNVPMPEAPLKACLQPAHLDRETKALAYAHKSHILLYYAGYDTDPLEQHVAVAAAAASMASAASFVLNESAHTALEADVLLPEEGQAGRMLETLRTLPLPLLYCGISKMEVEGTTGVWMRTYGAHVLKLPDLASHVPGHDHGSSVFEIFSVALAYMHESNSSIDEGDTMEIDDDVFVRLRAPTQEEWFLESAGRMLVVERIDASQINP